MTLPLLVLPRWNPRFVVTAPMSADAEAVLHFYNPPGALAKAGVSAARKVMKGPHRDTLNLIAIPADADTSAAAAFAAEALSELLGKNGWCLFGWTGSPGHERKLTFCGYDSAASTPLAFAKINAVGAIRARRLIQREAKILDRLAESSLRDSSPRRLQLSESSQFVCLLSEPLPGNRLSSRSGIDQARVDFLKRLRTEETNGTFAGLILSGSSSDTTAAHGDFTPWNLRQSLTGRLSCFDWEFLARRALGWDICHHELQIAGYFERTPVWLAAPRLTTHIISILSAAYSFTESEAARHLGVYCAESLKTGEGRPSLSRRATALRRAVLTLATGARYDR